MKHLSETIFSLFSKSPHDGEWVVCCLQEMWSKLVGQSIAEVSRPVRYERATLSVVIQDPSWQKTLEGMEDELLQRVQEVLPRPVNRIRFLTEQNVESV